MLEYIFYFRLRTGNDEGSQWNSAENERQSSETATSVPVIEPTIKTSTLRAKSAPSTLRKTTMLTTSTTSTLRPSHLANDVDASANGALNINLASISNNKSNQHILYSRNDSHWQQQRQKQQQQQQGHITLTSIVDGTNTNTAEYYQYFTDDSVKGKLDVPHFAEKSWMAFPVLRGAYKYVQVNSIIVCVCVY